MVVTRIVAIGGLTILTLSGCSWQESTVEREFGNSVRAMVAAQTVNPNPAEAGAESGDGQRLKKVIEDYRATVSERRTMTESTQLGVPGRSQQ